MRPRLFALNVILLLSALLFASEHLVKLRQALEKEKETEFIAKQRFMIITPRGWHTSEAILKKARPDKIRLEFLSSPFAGYVMVLRGENGAIIPPKGKGMSFPTIAPFGDMMEINFELLSRSAKVSLRGEEKVIGRTAQVFLIEPANVKGGFLKIWVDKETGVRLKTELYSPQGKLISIVALLSLKLNPSFDKKEFEVPFPLVKLKNYTPEELHNILGFRPLIPSYLPPGYTILHCRPLFAGKHRAAIIHLTDGLNPITIMETPYRWGHPSFPGQNVEGFVFIKVKNYNVVLMGNVDKKVLEKIGLSLR